MRKPTKISEWSKDNGCLGRTVKLYSYIVVLCEKEGCEVKAVRYDWYERKQDVMTKATEDYPRWNLKGVYRLYEQDFDSKGGSTHDDKNNHLYL